MSLGKGMQPARRARCMRLKWSGGPKYRVIGVGPEVRVIGISDKQLVCVSGEMGALGKVVRLKFRVIGMGLEIRAISVHLFVLTNRVSREERQRMSVTQTNTKRKTNTTAQLCNETQLGPSTNHWQHQPYVRAGVFPLAQHCNITEMRNMILVDRTNVHVLGSIPRLLRCHVVCVFQHQVHSLFFDKIFVVNALRRSALWMSLLWFASLAYLEWAALVFLPPVCTPSLPQQRFRLLGMSKRNCAALFVFPTQSTNRLRNLTRRRPTSSQRETSSLSAPGVSIALKYCLRQVSLVKKPADSLTLHSRTSWSVTFTSAKSCTPLSRCQVAQPFSKGSS